MASGTDKTIVLIAGQPKAGTTSLFDWLVQHPEVATAKLKEVRFFLDPEYPLPAPARYNGNNLDEFFAMYQGEDGHVLLDASPDYIGCDTPLDLPSASANAKAILIMRDPIDRMVSAYRFYRSRGYIADGMTFDDYVTTQDRAGVGPKTESHMRSLDHCRADHHIARWRNAYGDNLMVLEFDRLKTDPEGTIAQVYDFIGINSAVTVEQSHSNKTRDYKSPKLFRAYSAVRRWYAQVTLKFPLAYEFLRPIGRVLVKGMEADSADKQDVAISDETRMIIMQYSELN